jgi:hypothetical protein
LIASWKHASLLPVLDADIDLMGSTAGYGPFLAKDRHLGVASRYIWDNPGVEEVLSRLIYNNILIPQKWSYNFYPFVEYIILYGKTPNTIFYANPCLFEIFKQNPNELLRVKISTSDINFLRERIKVFFVKGEKATKEEVGKLGEYNDIIDILTLRRKCLPKNIALKISAFRIFRDMGKVHLNERIKEDGFDSNNFLKNQIEDFKIEYKKWEKSSLPFQPKMTDKSIHNSLKKLHSEYLKLLT